MELVKERYKYNRKLHHKPNRRGPIVAGLLAILTVFLLSFTSYALAKSPPVPAVTTVAQISSQTSAVSIVWPETGQSAFGDLKEGFLVESVGAKSAPIASMTKIITALAVLDKQPLALGEQGTSYTMTTADIALYNSYVAKQGSVMPVSNGQTLTQYQMLQGMLLPSANNIADSLAVKVFQSVPGYVGYANGFLEDNGITNTEVADASGFSPNTVSTPADMIRLGQMALNNPVIAEIVAQKEAIIPGSGTIKNTNQLLSDQNVVGIKTGTTDQAGSCLLFAVKHGPELSETLIGVVMGQPNWPTAYQKVRTLRDSALAGFGNIEVVKKDQVLGQIKSDWGQDANIVASEALSIYGWKAKSYTAT